jgi:hypothetical protein
VSFFYIGTLALNNSNRLSWIALVLTARRDKRRKKMALKTTSVPASKKGKTNALSPPSSAEDTDEDDDPLERKGSRHAKDKRDLKSKRERQDPSVALLKAYEVHGHLDRNSRITVSMTMASWKSR